MYYSDVKNENVEEFSYLEIVFTTSIHSQKHGLFQLGNQCKLFKRDIFGTITLAAHIKLCQSNNGVFTIQCLDVYCSCYSTISIYWMCSNPEYLIYFMNGIIFMTTDVHVTIMIPCLCSSNLTCLNFLNLNCSFKGINRTS